MQPNITIIKKDYTTQPFDSQKICDAIRKADEKSTLQPEDYDKIIETVENTIPDIVSELHVNDLHKIVTDSLSKLHHTEVSAAYRAYRSARESQKKVLKDIYTNDLSKMNIARGKAIYARKVEKLRKTIPNINPVLINYAIVDDYNSSPSKDNLAAMFYAFTQHKHID